MKKYWLYIEPYVFIWKNEVSAVIYNSLNYQYLCIEVTDIVSNIIDELEKVDNGYCIEITEEQLADKGIIELVQYLANTSSGGVTACIENRVKPFIFKPVLFLNEAIRKRLESTDDFLRDSVLKNLTEVSMFLPGICNLKCKGCNIYYRQILHCTTFRESSISIDDYQTFLLNIESAGVGKLNIISNSLLDNSYFEKLLPVIRNLKMKKYCYIHYSSFTKEYDLLVDENSYIVVLIHSNYDITKIEAEISLHKYHIIWNFVISSSSDLEKFERIDFPDNASVEITPVYTGENIQFFKENVYNTLSDILSAHISKKAIFRHQSLNENFFGKLILLPNGNVLTNINSAVIGQYPEKSLKEIVFKEMTEPTAWFRLRDKHPCSTCVNKYLCPSVSNYELFIGKDNLCTVYDDI